MNRLWPSLAVVACWLSLTANALGQQDVSVTREQGAIAPEGAVVDTLARDAAGAEATTPSAPPTTRSAPDETKPEDEPKKPEDAPAKPDEGSTSPMKPAAKDEGPWWLLGDAQIQTVSFSDPTASFAIGLQLLTDSTELRLLVRKGASSKLTAENHGHNFGAFVLTPSSSNLGASLKWVWYKWSPDSKIAGLATQYGPAVLLDAGQTTWEFLPSGAAADDPKRSENATAYRVTLGLGGRAIGKSSDNVLGISGHVGLTGRFIGGEMGVSRYDGSDRKILKDAIGTNTLAYLGFEIGFGVRVNSLDVFAEVPVVFNVGEKKFVSGLNGAQFIPTVSIRAPVSL